MDIFVKCFNIWGKYLEKLWRRIFEECVKKDSWKIFEIYFDICGLLERYLKGIFRIFEGYISNIFTGYLKDIWRLYMEDICRIMRNVEVEMKVWSPAGAHLSALKGALLVARWLFWLRRWQWRKFFSLTKSDARRPEPGKIARIARRFTIFKTLRD